MDLYTDGAFSPSRNQGGWCYYLPELHLCSCGSQSNTTNNRMELTAVIKALELLVKVDVKQIKLYSDSMYVLGGMFLNWSKASNNDLWEVLIQLTNKLLLQGKELVYEHINGHIGIKENELVDTLAVKMSQNGNS